MDRLTLDQLIHVLSYVDTKQRLSSCSLVNSTWRAAAATDNTSITVDAASPAFGKWLWSHSATVEITSLTAAKSDTLIHLPVPQLRNLSSLELRNLLWSPAADQPPRPAGDDGLGQVLAESLWQMLSPQAAAARRAGLAPLTALTRLSLTGGSVRLAGLEALTGLQELSCMDGNPASAVEHNKVVPDPYFARRSLVAAFPKLQRLSSLSLTGDIASPAVVSQLGSLSSLQQLVLEDATPHRFCALPTCLTQLCLRFKQPSTLNLTNAAVVSQLTAVEVLELRNTRDLNLSLLAGMCGLRSLQLSDVSYAAGSPDLQLLSRFTALTSLSIGGVNDPVYGRRPLSKTTAAEASAFTASSKLASIMLSGTPGQLWPRDYACLFPPSRQLQHLTKPVISADLLTDTAVLQQAGCCAPNLHTLHLHWPEPCAPNAAPTCAMIWEAREVGCVVKSLQAMAEWEQLRDLRLNARGQRFSGGIWQALGTFKQLSVLQVNCMPEPGVGLRHTDVLGLKGCRALTELAIRAEGYNISWTLNCCSTAPPGSPTNVWLRLPRELMKAWPIPL